MAGWRVGFCCGNREMIRALATIKGYYDYGMFQAIQIAAIMALRHRRRRRRGPVARSTRAAATCCATACSASAGTSTPPKAGMFVLGADSRAVAQPDEHDGLRHDAAGGGQRGRQPRQRLRPGRRGLLADVAGRERSPPAAGRAADQALPARGGRPASLRTPALAPAPPTSQRRPRRSPRRELGSRRDNLAMSKPAA